MKERKKKERKRKEKKRESLLVSTCALIGFLFLFAFLPSVLYCTDNDLLQRTENYHLYGAELNFYPLLNV